MKKLVPTVALTALALTASTAALAQTTGAAPAKPTVILIHGAFGDPESWDKVIPLLQKQGVPVVSVSIPLTSLADDASATQRAIDRVAGPVVLVGHSWGGTVITEAGNDPKVRALVYVAAFANRPGESVADMSKGFPQALGLSALEVDGQGYARMSDTGFAKFFAPGATQAERGLMSAVQGPINTASFGQPVTHAGWQGKPSWFALTTHDQMIVPAMQEAMAKQIGAHVTRIAGDHGAMVSHPTEVADVILAAEAAVD
ncbi:alpha/beta fold hydrolase [Pseudoroseomonas wenyumeiae]|uniref:Alpha/beta fold hydrolase n=1 Tax=Teichococcus wenyumeiae TaxID=2478470 RepID=A0A3A9JVB7_9PROT|nr:alpha/beta hydrolase [Pseudoroseomonas wenyumeiae]RKK02959.1 alpha/beta hydrolase [Pseudoroseomonas wenyumeiae]RMI17438.1 alpha/beta fold hydrolase [Pseudoroseomonas wenyumeiae]